MTTERPFALGQHVWLNSGSPPMLVVDFDAGLVVVSWVSKGAVTEDRFDPRVLSATDTSRKT